MVPVTRFATHNPPFTAILIHTVAMRFRYAVLLLATAARITNGQQEASSRLPPDVQAEVQGLGCRVRDGQTIVRGQFERAGVTDWAVLCWKARTTKLMVFWNRKALRAAELQKTFDGDGQRLSVRRIVAVDRGYILKHCPGARGKVSAIDHQGILDEFNGSVVHFYHQGAWLDLPVAQ
jgi:hypothetical protein